MNDRIFQTISPVDGSVYTECEMASAKDMETTLGEAQKAFRSWKTTTLEERAAICHKAVDYFIAQANNIGKELTWQMGRPIRYAAAEITAGFQERSRYMIDLAKASLADHLVDPQPGFNRFIRREPLGLILVLAPWNYPYLTSVNAIIPAIMAGNVVLLKHAQQTPLCAERYAEAFEHAGLPKGVFQFLHLNHEQVKDIINDSRVAYVAFTGSVSGGQAIQHAIGKRFISAGLELGGKDPAYVTEDARLPHTIENLVDGAFFNSGQSCCGIERIYVHEEVFDPFLEGFLDLTKKYILGNPLEPETTLGPMVRVAAADAARTQIGKAQKAGAKLLIDPALFPYAQAGTAYLAPQVLTNVDHSMEIMQEESFAPMVGIISVKNDEEAIQLMNDSRYGLTASIWTQDEERAISLGDQLQTGTFFMNRCDYLDPALAWTGVKDSGHGVTLSHLGYDMLTRPKSFHLKSV